MNRHSRGSRGLVLSRALMLPLSLGVAPGLGEAALRVLYRSPPGLHFSVRPTMYRVDPELAYALRPGVEFVWGTREFTEHVRINEDGFRDEPPTPRGSEARLLAIGDSFTYGHGVQMEESYPKVVQEILRADGIDARVINAGVPGYGLDQAYKLFRLRGEALAPDVLLVGIQCSDLFDALDVPLYDVREGQLVALDATRTWPYLQGHLAELTPRIVRRSYAFGLLLGSLRGRDPLGQRPHSSVPASTWAQEKIRLEVVDLFARGRRDGFAAAAVLTPCLERIGPSAADPYGSLATDLAAASVPTLDTLPAMQRLVPDLTPLFFSDDRHLTPEGNRVLAKVVATFIGDRGLPTRWRRVALVHARRPCRGQQKPARQRGHARRRPQQRPRT